MNEDERGTTPPDVTAMTLEPRDLHWLVIIEQGNGDVIKTIELTDMERVQLRRLLETPAVRHVVFADPTRVLTGDGAASREPEPGGSL
jgi:hypothetical protein